MPNLGSVDLLYPISGFCVWRADWHDWYRRRISVTQLLILVFGIHPATAVGTDLLFAASSKTIGTIVHATVRTVDWKPSGYVSTLADWVGAAR
jgi:hypothetical protein